MNELKRAIERVLDKFGIDHDEEQRGDADVWPPTDRTGLDVDPEIEHLREVYEAVKERL